MPIGFITTGPGQDEDCASVEISLHDTHRMSTRVPILQVTLSLTLLSQPQPPQPPRPLDKPLLFIHLFIYRLPAVVPPTHSAPPPLTPSFTLSGHLGSLPRLPLLPRRPPLLALHPCVPPIQQVTLRGPVDSQPTRRRDRGVCRIRSRFLCGSHQSSSPEGL